MSIEDLNLAEYKLTDLSLRIPPGCDLLHDYLDDALLVGRKALEVGPGNGSATAYLLSQGLLVDVLEYNADVIKVLKDNLQRYDFSKSDLHSIHGSIADFKLAPNNYALISASHVLHFLTADQILPVFERLRHSLLIGGIFLVRVHSFNDVHALENQSYVKHFFDQRYFDWFASNGFTRMYFSEVRSKTSMRSAIARSTAEGVPEGYNHYRKGEHVHFEAVFRRDI